MTIRPNTENCRAQDKPAAQVIREFMREYIDSHEPANDAQASKPGTRHSNKTKTG